MNSHADLLREEISVCVGSAKPSPALNYSRNTEHTPRRPAMKMSWNKMHNQSPEVICFMACLSESFGAKPWEVLEEWVKVMLPDYIANRSKQAFQLCA